MSTIVCEACGEQAPVINPFPCAAVDYGYPTKILLMNPSGSPTVAGDTPTLAEVQAMIALSDKDKMVVIEQITNGQRTEGEREEETGADTADGLTEVIRLQMVLTGRVKLLDETVREDLEKLRCLSRLRMWFVTSKGWIFGGASGYRVTNFVGQMILEGFGTKGYYPIDLPYNADLTKTDPARQDDGFLDLVNTPGT